MSLAFPTRIEKLFVTLPMFFSSIKAPGPNFTFSLLSVKYFPSPATDVGFPEKPVDKDMMRM